MPKARAEPKVRSFKDDEWEKLKTSLLRLKKFPREVEVRWKNNIYFVGWLHAVEKNCQSLILQVGFFENATGPEVISEKTLEEIFISY